MGRSLPSVVESLLGAADASTREAAWQEFVAEYSRLIFHVARAETGSHDAAMDRYVFVLEQLRASGFRRVRSYSADGTGKFTTWLVVVVRRLCVDEKRRRYGRLRADEDGHRERRRLADLIGADTDLDLLPDQGGSLPDQDLHARELRTALAEAVDRLGTADRLLLKRRFQDEVAVADIARILSLPSVFHVYRRLNGIYDRLRSALRGLGIEDAAP